MKLSDWLRGPLSKGDPVIAWINGLAVAFLLAFAATRAFATVPSSTTWAQYALGSNPQTLTVPFVFQNGSDLLVLDSKASPPVVLTQNSDYTVSGGNGTIGSVVTKVGGANAVQVGDVITIARRVPLTQTTTFSNGGPLTANMIGQALDKLTTITQQLNLVGANSFQFQPDEQLSGVLAKSARSGMVLGFSQTGGIQFYPPATTTITGSAAQFSSIALLRLATVASVANGTAVMVSGYYTPGDGGGGVYLWNTTSTAADNGGTIIQVTGVVTGRWILIYGKNLDARVFGVVADGTTNSTTALQACSTFSMTTGTNILLPPGTINISAPIDMGQSVAAGFGIGPKFCGAGKDVTNIKQITANTRAILWGGSFGTFTDCTISYSSLEPQANTASIAFEFYAAQWFTIARVAIENAQTGFHIYQGAIVDGANYVFNATIEDIYINSFTGSAMDLEGYNGGNGGMTIRNIWAVSTNGATPIVTLVPFIVGSSSDMTFQNINIQNMKCPEAFYAFSGPSIKISGLHIEGCVFTANFGGVLHCSGIAMIVENLTIRSNSFLVGNAANVILFRVLDNGVMIVNGGTEESDTITSTTQYFLSNDTTSKLFANGFVTAGFTSLGGDSNVVPQVKQIAENWRTISFGQTPKKWIQTTVAPATGTWAVGEYAENATPSANGIKGWVCIAAGTPGTWWPISAAPFNERQDVGYVAGTGTVTPNLPDGGFVDITGETGAFTIANPTGASPVYGSELTICIRSGSSTGDTITLGTAYQLTGSTLHTRNDGTVYVVTFKYTPSGGGKWLEIYRAG